MWYARRRHLARLDIKQRVRVCVDARHGCVDDSMVLKIQGAIASRRYAGGVGGGVTLWGGRIWNGVARQTIDCMTDETH